MTDAPKGITRELNAMPWPLYNSVQVEICRYSIIYLPVPRRQTGLKSRKARPPYSTERHHG